MQYKKKQNSWDWVYEKLMKYCAYQERSEFEVRQKAKHLGMSSANQEKAIKALQKDNFINERRFAEAFIRGKVKVKKWGPYKLKEGLFLKGVAQALAEELIQAIDSDIIEENRNYWVEYHLSRKVQDREDLAKTYRFVQSKGYSADGLWDRIKDRYSAD